MSLFKHTRMAALNGFGHEVARRPDVWERRPTLSPSCSWNYNRECVLVRRRSFGHVFARLVAMSQDSSLQASNQDSFGFLPWITVLVTALVVVFACLIATR